MRNICAEDVIKLANRGAFKYIGFDRIGNGWNSLINYSMFGMAHHRSPLDHTPS
jgi:hypothetical protein